MPSASVTNLFGTVVHTASPPGASVSGLFSTVVHSASPPGAAVANLFSTVVHSALPGGASVTNLYSTVAHDGPTFLVPDITGTVGMTASFDASPQGFPTGSTSYQWSWSSVPPGSGMANAILPLPDSGSTYPVSGNVGLWHFDSEVSTPTPQIGSVGLVDSYGDGWHGSNWVSVLVNSIVVINSATLGAGTGPEWYDYPASDGSAVEVIFSSLGSGGPHWGSECSYILNSGSNGTGVSFYTSPLFPVPPATPYSFTANGFLSGTITTTPDTSGQGNDAIPDGPVLVSSSYVGSHCYEFDGVDDFIDLGIVPSDIGIDGGNSRTIAFWASSSNWVDDTIFFSMGTNGNYQDFTFLKRTPSSLYLNTWNDDLLVPADNTPGWHHYFVIYDASDGNVSLYQDNLFLGFEPVALNTSDANQILIGKGTNAYWVPNGVPYEGKIDEFAIWNKALSACERNTIYNFLQTGSIDAASGSSPNLLEQFSFVPDVTGTYSIDLEMMDTNNCTSLTGTVEAVVGIIPPTGSSGDFHLYTNFSEVAWIFNSDLLGAPPASPTPATTLPLLPQKSGGPMIDSNYVINSYKALSPERIRRVDQVPFRLARKDRLGVRRIVESTPTPPPESEKIRIYENFAEVAWIASSSVSSSVLPPVPPPPAPMGLLEYSGLEIYAEAERAPIMGETEFHALEIYAEAERTPIMGETEFHALEIYAEAERTPIMGQVDFHGMEILVESERTVIQGQLEFSALEILVEVDRRLDVGELTFSNLEILVEATKDNT